MKLGFILIALVNCGENIRKRTTSMITMKKIFYARINKEVSNGFNGTYLINGETFELPVASTGVFLYTDETIPYWFSSFGRMIIYHFFYESPLKVSIQKKELVNQSGWCMFVSVLAPYPQGIEGTRVRISDSKLRCELDGVTSIP
ncbi:hypothetical protein LOTGIDRAFT_159534 [Lottia gigantea]|uniref:Uncharacterized protein n=1 Tax=Lottia gigantea TaxID=225164 RepID=V4ASS7_LOTGI|nr:hypothetical protein LOTGIDRAFT_159534 [Lottia gigantea]ESO96796.1 hypothetical protein LOTGIDRAFT_159534 [Lottia gigantea]